MIDSRASTEDLGLAGIRLFVHLYGGKQTDSLNNFRYMKFIEMTSCGKKVEHERLPPTERTAFFHSLRVHQQVVVWAKLTNNALVPQEWGSKIESNILSPIMTDLDPATANFLKFIRCKCKVASRNPCGTNLCMCHKNGLKCVPACGDCRGEACNNSEEIVLETSNKNDY